jgi:hypothetical protein
MKTHEQMLADARRYDDLTYEIAELRAKFAEAKRLLKCIDHAYGTMDDVEAMRDIQEWLATMPKETSL